MTAHPEVGAVELLDAQREDDRPVDPAQQHRVGRARRRDLVPAGEDEVGAVEVEAAARVEAQHLRGRPRRVECGVIGAQFVGAVDVIAREERGTVRLSFATLIIVG